MIEYLCIQRLCHRISHLLGLYFHFYLFLGSIFCDKLGLSWIFVTPKQNFHIQDFLDKTRSIHKRSFFPHSEGSLHDRCWEMSLYPFPVYSNLEKIIFSLVLNTSYLTDSYIAFTLKMESVPKITIFVLKMIMKG